ncbi:flavin reductase family protein [Chelatococcus sp. SYSU_G07232]|uniref:Flavin reductase family protein n=1 Tax=Chelatococcus albus TaxID=3047466 RepID=A0ABT7AJ20_9HYPH|nr:flavin reductase family protein [Chelatococcus sp. SYSU_G07232]MDJ1159377.1 flavin reductase family protein [Chelatococcus sp. SYSU_G07232]
MFYDTAKNDHGLPHDPFKALVVPRPIGWITSMGADGAVNLAPYSFFNAFSTRPPIVGFSSEGRKDSVSLVDETREFVCNIATYDLRDAMNATSAPLPRGTSEFEAAGLAMEPSRLVRPPRVRGIAAALECRHLRTIQLEDIDGRAVDRWLVLGQVIGIFIDDRFLKDGVVDTPAMQPIARLGYKDYSVVDEVFSLTRPAGG